MTDVVLRVPASRQPEAYKLSREERSQLNAIMDLLIPADDVFPPPSSLNLIDEIIPYLAPTRFNKASLVFSIEQLRAVLRDMNRAARGSFCTASRELQHMLLRQLEQRDPAFFQALWNLTNHSYYTRMAKLQQL